ncbi:RNA methyltransferase [Bifidobacterium aemilianum]|uniref:RNA methyltransferase n=1 Tax=Bifidobacterium aemilianum TaxID=2493120 RepID=A0A366K901_9BIFI|nr:TRAM domain-containing protein [Bifidobacterium aemilianum]RBP98220.1 RNA methyltransferase [Bifidobacterium aemilianum]
MQTTVRIERYADQGRCVGHIDGRVVFVRFALPGELVQVKLDEPYDREDRFWTGEVVAVEEASDDRVQPTWPLAGPLAQGGGVGGADLVHVSLEGQLRWKSALIKEQMRRMGHQDLADVPVERVESDLALGGLNWRTRIELIADEQGRPSMRRRGTHERVAIKDMPLASKALLAVAAELGLWQSSYEPGAQLRLAVPEPWGIDTASADQEALVKAVGDDYAFTVGGQLRAGSAVLREQVGMADGIHDYQVGSQGFWQVHRQAPEVLGSHLMELVDRVCGASKPRSIWDLYSGAGLFTLPLAAQAQDSSKVLSIEGNKIAAKQAHANLQAAGFGDVVARGGDVARVLSTNLPKRLSHPELIVLDPPRAGAKAKVCRLMAESKARNIIYIACDPTSLARDTAILTELGYGLTDIRAFDIYPMTHHVETVALFTRKLPDRSQAGRR